MKQEIRITKWSMCLRLVLFMCVCMITADAFSVNAPVTPELLLSLRASQGMDVSRDPLNVTPIMQEGQLVSVERKWDKAALDSAMFFLTQAFDIHISYEKAVDQEFSAEKRSFEYSVGVNERLVDALEKLVEASEGYIRWRLLDGRIVLTAMPDDDRITAGDRTLQVDIDTATMGEALFQLEKAYNEQHTDVPLAFYTRDYGMFHSRAVKDDRFRVKGQDTLRNIIISLMNQWDPAKAYYSLNIHRYVHKKYARQYFNDNSLYYYRLEIMDMEACREEEKRIRQGVPDEGFEEGYHWANAQFPEMSQRLMGYFDRIYPDWAAGEDAASAQEK